VFVFYQRINSTLKHRVGDGCINSVVRSVTYQKVNQ